jgi:hypothetical protein
VIMQFFPNGKHKRIEHELSIAADRHERRVNAGRLGGNARISTKQSPSNAQAKPKQPQPQPQRVPNAGPSTASVRDNHLDDSGLSTTPATRPKRQRKAKPADPLPRVEAHADRPALPTYEPNDDLPESANPETVRAEWKTRRRIPMPGEST